MPKLDEIYTSGGSTLKASDLQGKAVRVVIDSYEIREFDDKNGKSRKAVLKFQGKEKGLVMNKTNGQIIAHNLKSDDLDNWIGKQIILYPTRVNFGDEMVDAIRVREEVPEIAEDDPNDPLPF